MSPKPEHLNASVEREHQHHHPISHNSIQSLPVPAASSNSRFGTPLPALQDQHPRYNPTSSSGYENSSPTSTGTSSYTPYSNGFQPTSYPNSTTSNNFSYSLASDPHSHSHSHSHSRPRIPSMYAAPPLNSRSSDNDRVHELTSVRRQSPTSVMAPHNRSNSGGTKSVSPSLGSSVRSDYATSTPGLSRHLPSRSSQSESLQSPHSPMTPSSAVSPIMGRITSPGHDMSSNGLSAVNTAGPPLGETQLIHHLSSADGHVVRPEIQARVDKGFFLADRDWTCYRRNYFSVICSYSLNPSTYSLPLYLRRTPNTAPEHILAFAMCISAVVDAPGGKTVELVQHTPKRDKGPQHKPAKIKLSPQPVGGLSFSGSGASPVMQQQQQQSHSSHSGNMEHEYLFPSQQQQQHQQHIAVFDRIQFKSATANNGKRRAAQQYYHLIVELYADVGASATSAPGQPGSVGTDGGWVKIAHRISAPMVVRGRSPGHYADERRASSTSSPGGGSNGGNTGGGPHSSQHTSGGPGFMGPDNGLSSSSGSGGGNQGMMQHGVSSPPTNNAGSVYSGSPVSPHHETPIDPGLDPEVPPPLSGSYADYTYNPMPLFEASHMPPPPSVDSGYDAHSYNGDRKSEHPLDTSCYQHEDQYIPTTVASSDPYRKSTVKEEYNSPAPWLGGGALVGREQRFNQHNLFAKCGRHETADTSRGLFPDISPL